MELSWKLILYQAANFVVLMIILGFVFNRFIRPFMHNRANDIKQGFIDIENGKKQVERLKQDYSDQLHDMRLKAKAEVDHAIENGNAIRDEIVTKGEKEAINLLEKAKREIEHEKQKALTEIQREVASLAIQATRHLIHKQLDDQTNRKLVEDFLTELNNTSAPK
jgi:F-type H+-transporting ATPase subunit b